MSQYLDLRSEAAAALIKEWWGGLAKRRGDRAGLRRSVEVTQAYFEPAFHELRVKLAKTGSGTIDPDRLARVALVLSHVESDRDSVSFGAQMGMSASGEGNAPVSALRFRKLMDIAEDDQEGIVRGLRRSLALLRGTANLLDLANAAYWWNDRTKKSWALDYYGKTN